MLIFLKLFLAHLITDFFIQPKKWIDDKIEKGLKSKYLYYHFVISGLGALIALGNPKYWMIIIAIMISHSLVDIYKSKFLNQNLVSFLLNQFFHIFVLIGCSIYITKEPIIYLELNVQTLALFIGFLFVIYPAGHIVNLATRTWQNEINQSEEERDSLKNAGMWIGIFERILIVIFILINESQAIGFLIAAKSILRFSDRNQDNQRKQTEYVLIGTFISVTIAICTGIAVKSFY